MPAQPVGIGQQFVLRHQQCQLQALRATFLDSAARDDPLAAIGTQAIAAGCARHQCVQGGAQIRRLGQARRAAFDDQALAVRVGHGIAIGIEQGDFSGWRDDMFTQGCRQGDQRQVGADHCVVTTASGQGGADVVRGEKHIGFGGDLFALFARLAEPGATARIVAVGEVVLTTDRQQSRVEEQ